MGIGTRVMGAGRVLLLGSLLAATFVSFAVIAARFAVRAREVQVPVLTGRTPGEAGALLAVDGLALRVDDARKPDRAVPEGQVVAQDPAPGATVRRGRSVRAWVSAGDTSARMPGLVGESERSALLRLQQLSLTNPIVSEIASDEYATGAVVAQDPPAGVATSRPALLVNRGERTRPFVMPDLIGVSGEQAAGILRAAGFRVAVVGQQPYPGVPAGFVIRQAPRSGFQVTPGQAISLEVTQ